MSEPTVQTASEPVILTEKKGYIGYIILNRPKKLNAINWQVYRGLVSEENYAALIASMTTLNNRTGEEIVNAGAHACTDVTGTCPAVTELRNRRSGYRSPLQSVSRRTRAVWREYGLLPALLCEYFPGGRAAEGW